MRVTREPGAPRLQSRIHGPRRVLAELRRLQVKNARAAAYRAATAADQRWCARVGDLLEQLVTEGAQVLSGSDDPRERRRARKRREPDTLEDLVRVT